MDSQYSEFKELSNRALMDEIATRIEALAERHGVSVEEEIETMLAGLRAVKRLALAVTPLLRTEENGEKLDAANDKFFRRGERKSETTATQH